MGWQEVPLTRRKLLVLAGATVGGVAAVACERVLSPFTPTPTRPEIRPTPTPEKAILWAQEIMIPTDSDSYKKPDAFFPHWDRVFFTDPQGYPVAYDLDGRKIWQWEDKGIVYGAEPETVYVIRYDQRLCAIDSRTGQTLWRITIDPMRLHQIDWPLWINQDTLHSPLRGGFFRQFITLDKKSGSKKAQQEGTILGVTKQTVLAFGLQAKTRVTCFSGFNPLTGQEQWSITGGLMGPLANRASLDRYSPLYWNTLGMVLDKSFVYSYYPGELMLALADIDSGQIIWRRPRDQITEIVGSTKNDLLVENRETGYAWALDLSTGKTAWENDDLVLDQIVGLSQNTLIGIRDKPNFFYGLDPQTGQRKWRWEAPQMTAPPVIFKDKIVYGARFDLLVLDPTTGKNARNAPITLPQGEASKLVPHQDLLLVQTGKPRGRGTLSVVKI